MNENQKNPRIEWAQINNLECLKFTFEDTFTEYDALNAISTWKTIFDQIKGKKVILVWHCLKMTGYDPMARVLWQKTIKELKDRIDKIWLITDSAIIQAGATIISIFTSFHIKVVKSEDKIKP